MRGIVFGGGEIMLNPRIADDENHSAEIERNVFGHERTAIYQQRMSALAAGGSELIHNAGLNADVIVFHVLRRARQRHAVKPGSVSFG